MNFLQAIFLSIVEGTTEFLPISSTGHLILASKLINISQTEFVKSFEIAIQLGAILAIVCLYFRTLIRNFEIWKRVVVAFVPSGIIGLLVYRWVKTYLLGNSDIVIVSLFAGGVAILVLEEIFKRLGNKKTRPIGKLSFGRSAIVGVIQAISIIPGVSRAMVSIFGGEAVGLSRQEAVQFSFLLAVPTMLAATGLDLAKTGFGFSGREYLILFVGFGGAFLSALVTVRGLMNFVKKHSFRPFAVYRIILALLFWSVYH